MNALRLLKALALLVGMMVGAGMFALPYAVAHAGIFWSSVHFILAAVLVTVFHLLYGEVIYRDHANHRLPGYVRIHVGEDAYRIALWSRLLSYFGYLLAYGVLGGILLSTLVDDTTPFGMSIFFFLAAIPLVASSISQAGTANLLLTVPLVVFVGVLVLLFMPGFDISRFHLPTPDVPWFFPYGVFLFAFSGVSVIPEIVEICGRTRKKLFRTSVILGTIVVALIYFAFIFGVVGTVGAAVSQDALSSLRDVLGQKIFLLGALIGLLAISTSYIPLALELRLTLQLDLRLRYMFAVGIVAFVPLILFLFGINDFITILGVTGALGVGIEGALIALLAYKGIRMPIILFVSLMMLLALGALLEVIHALGVV